MARRQLGHLSPELQVRIAEGLESTDRLLILHQGFEAGQIGVDGAHVTFGGVVIGEFAGTTALEVSLNEHATP